MVDSPSMADSENMVTAGPASAESQAREGSFGAAGRRSLVFFDLDGTLVVGQTQLLLVKFLAHAGVVGRGFLVGSAGWFLGYKLGLLKATEASRRRGALVLKGLETGEVDRLMERFVEEELGPRLFPPALAALQEHQSEGDEVIVLSAALEPLVRALCSRLAVGSWLGASCETLDGRYTGLMLGPIPYGKEKARLAAQLMAERSADPAECWAYADHDTDIPLLETVGHPVAVRPRPGLRAVAEREGWPILG